MRNQSKTRRLLNLHGHKQATRIHLWRLYIRTSYHFPGRGLSLGKRCFTKDVEKRPQAILLLLDCLHSHPCNPIRSNYFRLGLYRQRCSIRKPDRFLQILDGANHIECGRALVRSYRSSLLAFDLPRVVKFWSHFLKSHTDSNVPFLWRCNTRLKFCDLGNGRLSDSHIWQGGDQEMEGVPQKKERRR